MGSLTQPFKVCRTCKRQRAAEFFEGTCTYCLTCQKKTPDRKRQQRREFWARHREKLGEERRKKYRADPTKVLENNLKWRQKNREYCRQLACKFRVENPEVGRMYRRQRRAREKNAEGTITVRQWEVIKILYGRCCAKCRLPEGLIKLTLDHVIPITKGGQHHPSNVQPLCMKCNKAKGVRSDDYR